MSGLRWTWAVLALLALTLGLVTACAPVKVLNALSPAGSTRAVQDISYGAGARHKLDVYLPERAEGAPVVVFFYGGNWVAGERADYAFVGRALAARGMVVVIPDYRLYPEVSYPGLLEDPAQAVAWAVRGIAEYGGDPQRMFVMGHSAGAYNAAMIALDPRQLARVGLTPALLRGWIGLAGPYDFLPIENPTTKPVFHYPDTPQDSQPVNHVRRGAPPALLIAPVNDSVVNPRRNTGGLAHSMRENQVEVSELYFDGVSHTTLVGSLATPLRRLAPTLDEVAGFVRLHETVPGVR